MLLETRGRMNARALAGALEVSVRTLYRDVDQLTAAGVPIFAERGRSGGFQLLEGWKTTLTGLTASEAQAVFLTGLAGPAAQLGLGAQVETAKLKLLTALPAPWREDAQRISSRLHLDPVDWYREPEPLPHLATVAAAVWHERQLTIRYESWKATARRTVSPLGLVLKAGAWYLVAAVDDKPRTYRISNIMQVDPALRARVVPGAGRRSGDAGRAQGPALPEQCGRPGGCRCEDATEKGRAGEAEDPDRVDRACDGTAAAPVAAGRGDRAPGPQAVGACAPGADLPTLRR